LQRLVTAAGMEGLELRDLDGYLITAGRRLRAAHDVVPNRRRLPLRWSVDVWTPKGEIPDGLPYVVQRHRRTEDARRVLFRPGTLLYLRDNEILFPTNR
jgi:hypothetical protein